SPLPQLLREPIRFAVARKVEGVILPPSFPYKETAFSVPPNSKVHIILDQEHLTTGYPVLKFSQGTDATVQIGYAESYYSDRKKRIKGNRHEIEGKTFVGYTDVVIADGG